MSLNDLNSLDNKMRERLEWSDVTLLRSLLIFIETQNWAARFDARSSGKNNSEDCSMDEVKTAVEFLTSHFRIPLESKGVALDIGGMPLEPIALVVSKLRRTLSTSILDMLSSHNML